MSTDLLEKAIKSGEINYHNIHFHQLHYYLNKDHGKHEDLDFGRKILTSHAEMDQYWHDYAWIVREQWDRTWQQLEQDQSNKTIHLVDHGCGQALGTILILDKYNEKIAKRIKRLTLIEPSRICIKRAKTIIKMYERKFGVNFNIEAINSDFDSIKSQDITYDRENRIMHLFSNTLDVENFDHEKYLLNLVDSRYTHKFICVSSHRNRNDGTKRFKDIHKLFNNKEITKNHAIHVNEPRIFNHRKTMKAVSMEMKTIAYAASR